MTIQKKIFVGVGTLLLFLFLVFLKVNFHARNEYQKGEKALQAKEFKRAITHFNRAIHWYSPVSQTIKDSIQALWEIGIQAEERGDPSLALQAFRALRSSLYSARSFYTPHSDWIEKCDNRIASILAQKKKAPSPDTTPLFLRRKEEVLKLLKTPTEPNVLWSLMLEIGLVGWIGCSIGFIFRVFTGQKGFNPKRALSWGIFIIFFYALWIVGMLKA